ncbi:protein-export membrane protein SecD [Desulfurobacterium thermolithotrophum DSM 11699]|uniref:Protein translocase subunit SecD n=1 Tax=Desulfurobacterium thermolithotrophum (strain DSM 11699 / BSA) TaxID=868864 RepID=F0S040_DESTD|nr:protein translocase subunit SecD [Desulfurobacterium thermolithotrophum]ADY73721.1 protein-export membrane protein SecD [Desulfurobacterium thermolithotrophum DSM 11699]
MKSLKYRIALVLLVLLGSIYVMFTKPVTLGLDLQGGTHLVLQIDVKKAIEDEVSTALREIKNKFEKENIPLLSAKREEKKIELVLLEKSSVQKAVELVKEDYGNMFDVKVEGEKLILTLKPSYISKEIDRLAEQALETIRNRIDELGVAEPVIVRNGKDRIIVELPGIKDPERAKKVIGKVAKLEFKEVVDTAQTPDELITKLGGTIPSGETVSVVPSPSGAKFYLLKDGKKEELKVNSLEELVKKFGGHVPEDNQILVQEIKDKSERVIGYQFFILKKEPILTGAYLKDAYPSTDEYGMPAVSFELNSEGARIFKDYTSKHIGVRLAIVLDNKVQSAPVIRSAIGGRGQITGQFSYQEAKDLSIVLRAGALPAPVKIIEETTVGPSLGKESIEKGIKAGVAGLIIVMLFMVAYYKLSGAIADLALLMNVAVLWAALALLGATLTLPGIAGFILTIGMAVDANVIIFERIREELRKGRNLYSAVEAGFSRAWGTIIDANVTTLVAAIVLFQFGTGPIKGFAVTLSLGILSSMFTAVFVTKVLLDVIVKYKSRIFSI